ncbi:efflux RND transporter periplasmic adaptor subunit [Terricaulis sp.]|uniref:efflux RND transporter periplasmic adaptor subunit n=1 Tax=Terricaulis sp. TaxID=2768686 RepID=UPI0037844634
MNAPLATPVMTRATSKAKELWAKRPGLLRGRNLMFVGGAAAVVLIGWMFFGKKSDAEPYRTAAVDRGSITRVVSATGTLQPLVSANVGSTVSGPVISVDADFNTQVRAGQILARLDPAQFQQRVSQAQATLSQAQAQYAVADSDYQRYQTLAQRGFASQQLMAQQRAARATAASSVAAARAALESARTDLSRTIIRAPIDGVVVDRQVNVGQSVAASFQAPTLFVIAQDLSRLQANITVDEADIGDVREGQPVRFTVDAFPDREFDGTVSQVRQQGVNDQGVVSYTVVVEADNPGRQLLPGMTANADIVLEERQNVLRVPNTALRFRPADERLQEQAQALTGGARQGPGQAGDRQGGQRQRGDGQGGRGGQRGVEQLTQALQLTEAQQATARQAFQDAMQQARANGGGGQGGDRRAMMRQTRETVLRQLEPTLSAQQRELLAQLRAGGGPRAEVRRSAVVWVLRNDKPTPLQVEIGIADNGNTLLLSGLSEGDEVIVGGGPRPDSAQQQRGGGLMGGGRGMRVRGG